MDTYTVVNICFSMKQKSEIIYRKKMILTHLFLQRLQYFRAQIPCEFPGGE